MKIRFEKVLLEKNERFSTPLTVVPWEVPVLIEAHGGGITQLGQAIVERKVRPDAQSEFQRLVNRYKHSESSDVPYVARVFGVGMIGVRAIEKMIQDSIVVVGSADDFASVETPTTDAPAEVQEVSDLDFVSGQAQEDAPVELQR